MCLNDTVMIQRLGNELAAKLKSRLADLGAVDSVSELITGNPKELNGELADHISISLLNNNYLVFRGGHEKPRTRESGRVDWSMVRRIYILGIKQL